MLKFVDIKFVNAENQQKKIQFENSIRTLFLSPALIMKLLFFFLLLLSKKKHPQITH